MKKILCIAIFLFIACLVRADNTIVFMSDFGVIDDSVAICKGVMLTVDPNARIIDITHQVPTFSILDGARFLAGATPYYPAGTVFIVVIDPGVGSSRRAIVAKSKRGQYFVLPDNGLLTLVEQQDGIEEARQITNADWTMGRKLSTTFHGRDVFSPVAAHVAKGDDWTQVGPVVIDLVHLDIAVAKVEPNGISGEVIALDGPYGNLITNISEEQFSSLGYQFGQNVQVVIGKQKLALPYSHTFSDVLKNKPLIYITSRGVVGLAVNYGNFSKTYHVTPPVTLFVGKPAK